MGKWVKVFYFMEVNYHIFPLFLLFKISLLESGVIVKSGV